MTTNMQTVQARLITHLKELHLPTFRERFSDLAEQARNEDASFEAYLLALCEEESEERRLNRIERMVRESQLPREKTLEALDLKRMGRKVGLQVHAGPRRLRGPARERPGLRQPRQWQDPPAVCHRP